MQDKGAENIMGLIPQITSSSPLAVLTLLLPLAASSFALAGCSEGHDRLEPDGGDYDVGPPDGGDAGDVGDGEALCVSGETECSADGLLRACVEGTDGFHWSEPEPCESSHVCREGACHLDGELCEVPGQGECLNDFRLRPCEGEPGDAVWGDEVACGRGTHCAGGECVEPELSELQGSYLELAREILAIFRDQTAWVDDFEVDDDEVIEEILWHLFFGGESDRTLFGALRLAVLAWPVGHQALYGDNTLCMSPDMFWQVGSRLGACARPYGEGFVVTHVVPDNPLGLDPGDLITSLDGLTGDDMIDEILHYPMCGSSISSTSHRRVTAATSIFASIPVGAGVEVTTIAGTTEELLIPDEPVNLLSCLDAMGRDTYFNARSYIRDDGIGVIQLPRFFPLGADQSMPYEEQIAQMEAAILETLDAVRSAAGIVWDVRANAGGISPVAFRVVGGMPGAQHVHIAHCGTRIPGRFPVELDPRTEFDYEVTPEPEGPFAHDGPVAVVVDGLAGSAADYFIRAVDLATDVPIIGTGAAGAYGGVHLAQLGEDPVFTISIDPFRCSDETGEPLEGRIVEPHIFVEQAPEDMAIGIDTQLEAAVAAILE